MKLIRVKGLNIYQLHQPPSAGGYFFALEGFNDLPEDEGIVVKMELTTMLKSGVVYMADAENPHWVRIFSEADVPHFSIEWRDNYEACTTTKVVLPFMPEFYFVPAHPMPELDLSPDELDQVTANKRYVEIGSYLKLPEDYLWWRDSGEITLNGETIAFESNLTDAIEYIRDITGRKI